MTDTLTYRQRLFLDASRTEPRQYPYVPAPRGHDGESAEAAARRADIADGIRLGMARAALRQAIAANPHVTAFPQLLENTDPRELRKASDLLQHAGRHPRERHVLADPDDRLAKLCIETGTDPRTGRYRAAPLEPWTGPSGSLLMYADLMRDQPGAHSITEYGAAGLAALAWMRDEELIVVGNRGEIYALSDADPGKGRKYPGAAVPDARAKIGDQLRDRARGLVLAALFNLSSGRTVRRGRKRRRHAAESADGMRLTAAQVCAEANAIKARRPDLDGCRYLSLSRCRELIRDLIERAVIEQIEPPRATRQRRSWRTIPRMLRRLTEEMAIRLGLKPPHTTEE